MSCGYIDGNIWCKAVVGLPSVAMRHRLSPMMDEDIDSFPRDRQRRVVCRMCGAALEVVVNFSGKIVWPVSPADPEFGTQAPSLRGDTKSVRVVCSADVMHACGYICQDGVLVKLAKKQ